MSQRNDSFDSLFGCVVFTSSRMGNEKGRSGSNLICVRNRVSQFSFAKCAQPQCATVAFTTGQVFALVTRPAQLQWCAKFDAALDDLAFAQMDDGRDDLNLCFR